MRNLWSMANHPLKKWRLERKLTQSKLGEELGVTKASVCRYEKGDVPGGAVMVKIHALTHGAVTPNDWLPKSEAAE